MYHVTSYYLTTLISDILRDTIYLYRESKNTFYFDGDYYVAEQEIYQFIYSTPYFSLDLKEFLYHCDNLIFIEVEKEWFCNFLEKIYLWTESDEWLYYDFNYISNPSLNKTHDREELDLSSYNKAVFYCERFF
jgi:hypothetical protein